MHGDWLIINIITKYSIIILGNLFGKWKDGLPPSESMFSEPLWTRHKSHLRDAALVFWFKDDDDDNNVVKIMFIL